ncbi:nucleotidyltransferase [Candidatus Peregrinibacteria bacterium]|nr:nucleotidyltransferase [Candidatus Peregrinibacteria bacterium]
MKVIGHIDADCFYVSCERVRAPNLKNKPVAVLGNQGACVIARSYEMRPFGVSVGMPVWEAKKLCPEGIFVRRDFKWYSILSYAMQDVLKQFSDVIEYYSIDESFVDFGEYNREWKKLGKEIQEEMLKQTGIPVSVGISMSRVLAKTASDKNKPLGVTVVNKENLKKFLKSVPVIDVPGIGRKLNDRLEYLGVKTVWDYVKKPSSLIKKVLHKPGEEIWYEMQGKSLLPIRSKRPERKAMSRGCSLWGYHNDPNYVWAFLVRNLERLADGLFKEEMEILNLTVLLVSSDGQALKQVEKLPDFTNDYFALINALRRGFWTLFTKKRKYTSVHLFGDPLRTVKGKQLNLFEKKNSKNEKIVKIKQQINRKYGMYCVRSGATAYIPEVFEDKTSDFEISDIEGKFCF